MLVKRIETAPMVRIRVGDITVFVMKIGDKTAQLAVDAPDDMKIFIDNEDTPPQRR